MGVYLETCYPDSKLNHMMETPALVTMLAAIASLIGIVFESFRRSRCVSIKSCCGLFEIERNLDGGEDEGKKEESSEVVKQVPQRPHTRSQDVNHSS